jgi:hypothetical protein
VAEEDGMTNPPPKPPFAGSAKYHLIALAINSITAITAVYLLIHGKI